ncbi:ABC transporter permease [Streptomyces sp. NPDC057539]|uniref:ABC transporter permease n=1 Tax=Streptomyces sp. NPDC057539 TaxID=3346159 RepID=UPI003680F49A
MSPADVLRVGGHGLRARPMRVFLSALGIAIGIAAMVGVVGISTSSAGDLERRLSALGTNLLSVTPGPSLSGDASRLPGESVDMVDNIPDVESVTALGEVDAKVYRNDHIPEAETSGIAVKAAKTNLPGTTGAKLADGRWLNAANDRYPSVVLGPRAAEQLGVHRAGPDIQVWLGERWFTVIGVLAPNELIPQLDTQALVGWPYAQENLGFDGYPTQIHVRVVEEHVTEVQGILGATVNPYKPDEVAVSRPSDALAAKEATDDTLSGLLLGLGAVALLVGGVGVANTMVISVLERRSEIGLRRSLGATRGQIRNQFLCESQLLSLLGGVGGVALGIAVTIAYATYQGWPSVIPVWAMAGGVGSTLVIGALAGFYPAVRAARLPPTEALATP